MLQNPHQVSLYPMCVWTVCVAYRSRGAPWPLWRSVSVGGRSVAACPAGPGPQDSPSAGSLSAQTVPNASCSACRHEQTQKTNTPLLRGHLVMMPLPQTQTLLWILSVLWFVFVILYDLSVKQSICPTMFFDTELKVPCCGKDDPHFFGLALFHQNNSWPHEETTNS